MLLHWLDYLMPKDQLEVFMQPQQLTLVRRHGLIKKRVVQQTEITFPSDATAKSWSPAVAALGMALKLKKWRDAVPTVILSNHFVHYAVIPWNKMLNNAAEKQAYLKHCFVLAYGESAKSWDLRMSDAGHNMPALASGIEPGLLSALRDVLIQANMTCRHIRPHLMSAINQLSQQKAIMPMQDSIWFVLLEPGRICLALIKEGAFVTVKTCAAESDITQQINAMIRRESVLSGLDTIEFPVLMSRGFHGITIKKLTLNQISHSLEVSFESRYAKTSITTHSIDVMAVNPMDQPSIRT